MSEVIQAEWETLTLGHIFSEIRNGCSIEQSSLQSGVPVTRIETISSGKIDYQKTGWLETDENIDRYKLDRGDILLSHINSMSHIGKVAIKSDDRVLYHGMNLLKLKVNKDICEPIFAYNLLTWDRVRESLRNRAKQAINQASINVQDIKTLAYALPPLPEQQKIATILSSVDDVIEKTRAQIDKLKDLKTGMMQELLTQGIGHTEFKNSPVGRIPASWNVVSLSQVLKRIDSGWSPLCINQVPSTGEWGVLKVSAVTRGEFLEHESKLLPDSLAPRKSALVHEGDILLTRANGVADLVGKCVMVRRKPKCNLMLSDKILRLNPSEKLLHEFLLHVFNSQVIRTQIELSWGGSSGQKNISQSDIRSYLIPLPSIEEQSLIANAISGLEKLMIDSEERYQKLQDLKKALMQDLLTGKVRVKLDPTEVAAA